MSSCPLPRLRQASCAALAHELDAYRRLYLEAGIEPRRCAWRAPTIEADGCRNRLRRPSTHPRVLFEDGVICGKASSLEGLEGRVRPDMLLAAADGRGAHRRRRAGGCARQELASPSPCGGNLKSIKASSSWR